MRKGANMADLIVRLYFSVAVSVSLQELKPII
jgi:hypothetical protein